MKTRDDPGCYIWSRFVHEPGPENNNYLVVRTAIDAES